MDALDEQEKQSEDLVNYTRPDWLDRFLHHFRRCGVVAYAARRAGKDRRAVYYHLKRNPDFRAEFAEAEEEAIENMEREAWRRAFKGTKKPVYQNGQHVGDVMDYSDTLAIFLLKARKPERYRENAKVIVGGDPNNPVLHDHEHKHELSVSKDDIRAAQAAIAELGMGNEEKPRDEPGLGEVEGEVDQT